MGAAMIGMERCSGVQGRACDSFDQNTFCDDVIVVCMVRIFSQICYRCLAPQTTLAFNHMDVQTVSFGEQYTYDQYTGTEAPLIFKAKEGDVYRAGNQHYLFLDQKWTWWSATKTRYRYKHPHNDHYVFMQPPPIWKSTSTTTIGVPEALCLEGADTPSSDKGEPGSFYRQQDTYWVKHWDGWKQISYLTKAKHPACPKIKLSMAPPTWQNSQNHRTAVKHWRKQDKHLPPLLVIENVTSGVLEKFKPLLLKLVMQELSRVSGSAGSRNECE